MWIVILHLTELWRTTSEEDLSVWHQPTEFLDAFVREIGVEQIDGAKAFQLHQMR